MRNLVCGLLDRAARWVGRLLKHDDAEVSAMPVGCSRAARTANGALAAVMGRARNRHADRYRRDEQYRAVLLAAVGAMLSTLLPPPVAAVATALVGYSGLLDRLQPQSAGSFQQPRYTADDRPAGSTSTGQRLWDRFADYGD